MLDIAAQHRSRLLLNFAMRGSATTLSQSGNPLYNLRHRLGKIATALSFAGMSPMVTIDRHYLLYMMEIPCDDNSHINHTLMNPATPLIRFYY